MRSMLRATLVAFASLTVAGVAQAQQSIKIAYVNTQALMEAAPGRTEAEATLQKESDSFKSQLQKMQDSLNNLIADYQKKEPTLSATQKDTRQKGIQTLESDLQAKNLQLQQQFAQRQNELFAPITEAVKKVLDDIRAEDGYALILANDPGQSQILSADKNLDITERVVARLRTVAATKTGAPGTAQATPASKPANGPAGVTRPKPPAQ